MSASCACKGIGALSIDDLAFFDREPRASAPRAVAAFVEKTLLGRDAGPETLMFPAQITVDHHAQRE